MQAARRSKGAMCLALLLACHSCSVSAFAATSRASVLRIRLISPMLGPERLRVPIHSSMASSDDLSSDFSNYRNSKGLRIRTWGPVRHTIDALASLASETTAFGSFLVRLGNSIPVSRGMMGLMLLAFGAQSYAPKAAMLAGARVNRAITVGGQWHRLVSPVFLHGGAMHLFSNLFSLFRIGPLVDASFGPARVLLIYLLSGIGGNLCGLWFGPPKGMSIGASGAVFGMIGATGGYVLRNRRALGSFGDSMLGNAASMLLLNLFIGMRSPGIDNLAHVGGFASGLIVGALVAPRAGSASRRGRFDGYGTLANDDDDGALLPPWVTRALLSATCVAYMLGLREAVRIARRVMRVYGAA